MRVVDEDVARTWMHDPNNPTKVVRTALQNAASVAGMLLTTEAMVADKPEDKEAAAPEPSYDDM